jgi:GNAT superfamily N-acetyltransferase
LAYVAAMTHVRRRCTVNSKPPRHNKSPALFGETRVMKVRVLNREELQLIWKIDRSEIHHHIYTVVDGELQLVPAYFDIPGWAPGKAEADTPKYCGCFDRGGIFIGEFDDDAIVGASSIDPKPIGTFGDHVQLFSLHVSRLARGRGIGSKLFHAAAQAGRLFGAKALYISATPTENTVRFYLSRGATLISEPDPELFAAEPEDIHLTYRLSTPGNTGLLW